jgi:hypothetical protein
MNRIFAALVLMPALASQAFAGGTAFLVREVQTGGMTKQCVYDYLGSEYVVTVSVTTLCALSIRV